MKYKCTWCGKEITEEEQEYMVTDGCCLYDEIMEKDYYHNNCYKKAEDKVGH